MEKIAVIYWSASGNTEKMANSIVDGIKKTGTEYELFQVADFPVDRINEFSKIAFGCPAMGAEELEINEFEPVLSVLEPNLAGKTVALFGSYDWGDGEWMRTWQERTKNIKAILFDDQGLIIHNTPDDDGITACQDFGQRLAQI